MMAQMKLEKIKLGRGLSRGTDVLILLAAIFTLTLKPSYAYIDPGTGSFMLQMAIAGILGALFTLKTFWQQVKAFVVVKILHRASSSKTATEPQAVKSKNKKAS